MTGIAINIRTKAFGEAAPILCDLQLSVPFGRTVSLLGPSGIGKTTILRLIAGLDREYDGTIQINDRVIMGPSSLVGIVFQDAWLLPWCRVSANITFGLRDGLSGVARRRLVDEALALVGLPLSAAMQFPRQLSGGMAKRVALARALVAKPQVLLLDEPLSGLDTRTRYDLQDTLQRMLTAAGRSIDLAGNLHQAAKIIVTHDIEEAVFLSDEIVVLSRSQPAQIKDRITVELPRPRQRESDAFRNSCARVLLRTLDDASEKHPPDKPC